MNEVPVHKVVSFSITFLCALLLLLLGSCAGTERETVPAQPIAFNHKIHAGEYQMPCLYCHAHATSSPVAGVPPVKTCMGCHEMIGTERPEIEKLTQFWEERRPIEWIKIYDLPDYVRFNHSRHVLGGVICEDCHGPVQEMAEVRKQSDLSMGWCLKCHKKMSADIDCFVCHY